MSRKSLSIFSLNAEYGKYSPTLIPYIESISGNFDVFCLQEVPRAAKNTLCFEEGFDADFYQKLEGALPEFIGYYWEYVKESFGIVTFVKKGLKQKYKWEEYMFGFTDIPFLDTGRWNNSTKCMCVKVEGVDIVNLHGAWQPKSKKQDTPERLRQSKIIRKFTRWREHKTVLIWDFNLMPDTESIKILEEKYDNLITKFGIKNTRTAVYDDASLPFAEYAFVWENLQVQDFSVSLEPIFSDHGFMELSIQKK